MGLSFQEGQMLPQLAGSRREPLEVGFCLQMSSFRGNLCTLTPVQIHFFSPGYLCYSHRVSFSVCSPVEPEECCSAGLMLLFTVRYNRINRDLAQYQEHLH